MPAQFDAGMIFQVTHVHTQSRQLLKVIYSPENEAQLAEPQSTGVECKV